MNKLIQGFDNWEKESLRLFKRQDLEILLDDFVEEDKQEDFLHNLADMMFRLNKNLTEHNNDFKKSCPDCNNNVKCTMVHTCRATSCCPTCKGQGFIKS